MNKVGRPRKELITEARTFKITPQQIKALKKILINQYPGGNKEEDMSHIVRLALDDYLITYYKDVL